MSNVYDVLVDNLVDLPIKMEDAVLEFIESRFLQNEIYMWAGQTLIALNPYTELNKNKQVFSNDVPHIYTIVDRAWMRFTNKLGKTDQSIIISGETGSGKTFSTCLAIKYIVANKHISNNVDFEKLLLLQILSSIPLLTAFGNAPTVHNSNSSRFGKLLQLQYKNEQLKGAIISPYMLEKSRVIEPNIDEGNFHIFQLMLDNLEENKLSSLFLSSTEYYKILTKTKNSTLNYKETMNALEYLKINEKEDIFIVLSIILNLGNVDFELNNENYIISAETLKFAKRVANLLQVDIDSLDKVMTTRVISAGSRDNKRQSVYCSSCINKQECEEIRNSLMKLLYEKMFLWLINCINKQISKVDKFNLFGILDIYGFEVFTNNTFEQLCINYANEKLQHYFINDYLIERQKSYENNAYVEIFENNEYVVRMMLLDGCFPSLFSILDEECKIKRYNNDYFINARITEHLKHYPHFLKSSNNFNTFFSIKHFAGVVKYNSANMVAKNNDKVSNELIIFLKDCKFKFIDTIVLNSGDVYENKGKTLLSKFKKSLDDLMVTLSTTDVHYIKCIKPNNKQKPQMFDQMFVAKQLKMFGVFEILKLSHQNYTIKVTFEEFNKLFTPLLLTSLKDILKFDILIGSKHVYLTERGFNVFKRIYTIHKNKAARILQRKWRKLYAQRYSAALVIQKFFKEFIQNSHEKQFGKFIDISKKTSYASIKLGCNDIDTLGELPQCKSHAKTLEYVENLQNIPNLDGDPISLTLEKIYNSLETMPFARQYFRGCHIISRLRIPKVPVRIRLSKTCIPFSHVPPLSERPKGLSDIL